MIRTIVIGLASALALAACSKTVDTACTAFVPITYSVLGDSAETITQVRQHNAAWTVLCR